MAIGRISGPLLKENLVRNGINIAFETDLLYLDVVNQRIGIRKGTPQHELDVNGTIKTSNLIVTNRADIADITIENNTISTTSPYLNLATLDTVVALNKLRIDNIDIEGNAITTNSSNANLELRPNGTGSVDIQSNLNVDGNIYVTGNITADGTINLGDTDTDNVVFNAEIASDIIPDLTNTYSLGSDPTAGGKEWNDLWVNNIVASSINSAVLDVDGIDLTLRQGNIWYVAKNGNDLKSGDHIQDPYASVAKALSVATPGDTVYIFPGEYEEIFPLTIPVGVTVKGQGLRSVKIVPTVGTQFNDAFLLNGETTVEDITIADFYSSSTAEITLSSVLNNPSAFGTSASDNFGFSVAISGNYAIVGAYNEDDAGGTQSGKAYIFNVTTGALVHTLNNPNAFSTSASDSFGHSVAISGNYAIVGAYNEDDAGGGSSGKAYIFNVTTGALVHTLNNPNAFSTSTSDLFGFSVAISGNYAIVGAYNEGDAGGSSSGKAYIYNVTTGALMVTLNNSNAFSTSANDVFGQSVGISGNYAIVGAYGEDDAGGLSSGKAYIYNLTNLAEASTSTQAEFGAANNNDGTFTIDLASLGITNPGLVTIDSIDIRGDLSTTGSEYIDLRLSGSTSYNRYTSGFDDATYRTFAWLGGQPTSNGIVSIDYIIPPDVNFSPTGMPNGYFWQVRLNLTVNGARLSYVLNNPNAFSTSASDLFGFSVAISDNYAIVGAYSEDDAGGGSSGKAYIYNVTTGTLVHTLNNPNAFSTSASDIFGYSVGISGNYAIVGAYSEDDAGGLSSGKAYIFSTISGQLIQTINNPNAFGTSASDLFGHSVAISDNYAIVGAYSEDDAGGTQSGKAYIYNLTGVEENGYAFRYAPGFTVTSRSPYIKNTSVITKGSVTTLEDPRGFNAGNAGRGAYLDGAIASSLSNEAACLFHTVTFITPGVDAIVLTNGVRVEWLNSFTYFANRSIYAVDGASGLKGQGETAIRVDGLSGTIGAGQTISYYDSDGITLLGSGTIASVDGTGKIFIDGKQLGFETAAERGGKVITPNGDAKLSTAVKKFGTASLALDGTGDYALIQSTIDFGFGTGDFTIDGWFYKTAALSQILVDTRTTSTQNSIMVQSNSANNLRLFVNGVFVLTSSNAHTLNAWNHLAISRVSGVTRFFINGVVSTNTYVDATDYGTTKPLILGASFVGLTPFSGYIDDLRIIKGVGLYTTTFTAPITRALVTADTVLMARFDGVNNSTVFEDDVVYAQDIRFSGGATAQYITLTDFTDFGAEVRLIGSASVYGNYGLVGDGPGVLMYAISQNLAYIGNGKEVTNDPTTVIQGNEVIESNGAKIRYNSIDHKGDFRVGDLFYINQEDGTVDFSVSNFTINTTDGVTFTNSFGSTFIDGTKIETGDWRISGNTIETLTQDAEFTSAGGEINLNGNVNVTGDLDVTGNVTIGGNITIGDEATDTIQIVAGIESNIVPTQDTVYSLGTSSKRWNNLWVNELNVGDIQIRDNFIQTVISNADLELRANGTGNVIIPNNDVIIDNDLTVSGQTVLGNTSLSGFLQINGDLSQTGSVDISENLIVGQDLFVAGKAQFEEILIDDNFITTTSSNADLELRASGIGKILIPNNAVEISSTLTVNGEVSSTNLTVSGQLSSDSFTNSNLLIDDNYIAATGLNSNLELRANGSGLIYFPSNDVVLEQNLTVNGSTNLKTTVITGSLAQTGNVTQTGTFTVNGSFTNSNIVIDDNFISTTESNSDLELRANGTGKVLITTNDVEITNDLIISGETFLTNTNISGSVTHTGTVIQTGNLGLTGDYTISGLLISDSAAQFENIKIDQNILQTTASNSDLELRASGTGTVLIPNNDVVITNNLRVDGTISVGDITALGTITANRFSTGDILIDDNFITTTTSNSSLELRANGTGNIIIPENDLVAEQNLTVQGQTTLGDVDITGNIIHTGNTTQAGNYLISGTLSVTDITTFSSAAQFENIKIDGNVVTTTESNSDLELRASGTGTVLIPSNDVIISNDLTVNGTLTVGNIVSLGTIQANNFSTGDILIDDNFITTTTSNSNLELRANGTGSVLVSDLAINQSTISSVADIVLSPGSENVVISSIGALKIPVGTTLERPTASIGQIRFNSTLNRFEGYTGTNWIQLAGVADVDGDTKVTAELTEGANDNVIRFDVAGATIVDVNSTRLNASRISVDDIIIDGNTISTTTNTDLVLDPQGTGSVIIDNFSIRNNTITNTVTNSITTFNNTGDGYIKFSGTYGMVIPAGGDTQRPPLAFTELGQMRWNTDSSRVEIFDGSNWVSAAGSASGISRADAESLAFEIVLSLG